jgi:uncharacterized protein (DUF983 family)
MSIHLNGEAASAAKRDTGQAMLRGALHTCPKCGKGDLYASYLKVAGQCARCGQELHHHRADDAPPYFTILIVGHIAVGGVLTMEQAFKPSAWLHVAIWMPLVIILSLLLLPRIKGMLVGLQWALRMHGFGGTSLDRVADVAPEAPVQQTAGN